ncbi:sulfite exporter TauE/SafE family protein [Cryomorphaceae bacterium 1068]|nr:sulfite exporter TauE/SafE family protein [Cryomorphaceae bacterium 1068]
MIFLPALGLGFAGSLHCVGMCGPIAMAIPVGNGSPASQFGNYFLYHFGRISSYALLGFLFGTMGYGLNLAGIQQGLSLAVGLFMVAFIWLPKLFYGMGSGVTRLQSKVTGFMAKRLKTNRPGALLGLGFFNGLLPCGFVYLALAGALVSYNPIEGAVFMALFGLGTTPALLAVAFSGRKFGSLFKARFRKLAPVLATVVALLFILRGLGLGIPYVSPELGTTVQTTNACQ